MTLDETKKLKHGVYRLFWKKDEGGNSSLAVVGSMHSGARWFACANWTGKDRCGIPGSDNEEYWGKIEKAELIEAVEPITGADHQNWFAHVKVFNAPVSSVAAQFSR